MSFWRPPLSYTVKAVEAVGEAQEGREKDGVEAQGGVPGVIFRERPPVVALAILLLQTLLHLMRLFPFSFSFLSPSFPSFLHRARRLVRLRAPRGRGHSGVGLALPL